MKRTQLCHPPYTSGIDVTEYDGVQYYVTHPLGLLFTATRYSAEKGGVENVSFGTGWQAINAVHAE